MEKNGDAETKKVVGLKWWSGSRAESQIKLHINIVAPDTMMPVGGDCRKLSETVSFSIVKLQDAINIRIVGTIRDLLFILGNRHKVSIILFSFRRRQIFVHLIE
jgi:hypothetical protein